ncbi:OBAP family protein [Cupriavidus plantarum]|uniref:OBAP family protein n=1 Tax=Cupriavidus plantarum TaxID=942865 RepID=UPI0015C7885B|nr:OBAP family protein [Cupriavidus plantarum]NYH99981.1 hypothetical protein [Cupriavidus plantarum]
MRPLFPVVFLLTASILHGCGRQADTPSNVQAPGEPTSPKTSLLEGGAAALQTKRPIDAINTYLDGFHFYNGQQDVQMEAHHYCSTVNEDAIQCVIYDGNMRDAKIMGVEYIISAKLFATLDAAEKALWHSHVSEVKSGQLVAPGIPEAAEKELMKKLVGTYGKTWHTWHTDLHKQLPLGVPQLMMGFTGKAQARPAMVAERDNRMKVDSEAKRKARSDIPSPSPDPLADGWQYGNVYQPHDPQPHDPQPHDPTAEGRTNLHSPSRP